MSLMNEINPIHPFKDLCLAETGETDKKAEYFINPYFFVRFIFPPKKLVR